MLNNFTPADSLGDCTPEIPLADYQDDDVWFDGPIIRYLRPLRRWVSPYSVLLGIVCLAGRRPHCRGIVACVR